MKRLLITSIFFFSFLYVSTAGAVDLSTIFGSPKTTPAPITQAMVCTITKTTITANGIDSTVVSAQDLLGNAITNVDVRVVGLNGIASTFSSVTLPKTVTSSVPGQWDFTLTKNGYNSNCNFSIVAQ